MKIAFFSEMGFNGKVDRTTHNNMRTEFAWMTALDADHYNIHAPNINHDYDLGVVIIPKNNPEFNISNLKKHCNKIAIQQEGPFWYFQDYTVVQQFHFHNYLMEADYIFSHNELDKRYYEGITSKPVFVMRSLMITDKLVPRQESGDAVIMGGNFVSWYGGFDSYISTRDSGLKISAVSMGRKQEQENLIEDINYLPYMNWRVFVQGLSQYRFGVHLMRTHAAGTFSMNLGFHGIPCVGYKGLDTQELIHPLTTVEVGDLDGAKRMVDKLTNDEKFYELCVSSIRKNFSRLYSEKAWKENWKETNK